MKSIIKAILFALPLIGPQVDGQGVVLEESHAIEGTVTYPDPNTGEPVTSAPASASVKVVLDTDGDGLKDSLEDTNGNRVYDPETDASDFQNEDTDGDGILDSEDQVSNQRRGPKIHDFILEPPVGSSDLLALGSAASIVHQFHDFERIDTGGRFQEVFSIPYNASNSNTNNDRFARVVQTTATSPKTESNVTAANANISSDGFHRQAMIVGEGQGLRMAPLGHALIATPNAFTFGAWINLEQALGSAKKAYLFSSHWGPGTSSTASAPNFTFRIEGRQLSNVDRVVAVLTQGSFPSTTSHEWVLPQGALAANSWHHIRLGVNGGQAILSVDGLLQGTKSVATLAGTVFPYFVIGGDVELGTLGITSGRYVFKPSTVSFKIDRLFGGHYSNNANQIGDLYGADTDGDGVPDVVEISRGEDPLKFDNGYAPDGDYDGDGLTNLYEETNGTDPFKYDSDGDLYGDGWEIEYGYNPQNDEIPPAVAPNPDYDPGQPAGPDNPEEVPWGAIDSDGDGLSNWEEHLLGTDPEVADTDTDGFSDLMERNAGSDPTDPASVPLRYSENGPEAGLFCGAFGTRGVFKGEAPNDEGVYNLMGGIGDWSDSKSERWELLANGGLFKANVDFGTFDAWRAYLKPDRVYRLTMRHGGSQGDGDFDYGAFVVPNNDDAWAGLAGLDGPERADKLDEIQASLRSGAFGIGADFVVCNTADLLSNQADLLRKYEDTTNNEPPTPEDEAYKNAEAYLVPITKTSYSASLNISGSDAAGPRFRKVALNGRPIADEKPESEDESDAAREETYVDAFDLALRHDTSFIYLPLASTDLTLQVSASARETTWKNRSGLNPEEEITSPFGAGWSSNLCSYVEVIEPVGDAPRTDPISVNVVDEDGRPQRFGTNDGRSFFAWPSGKTDRKTYLNTLDRSIGEGGIDTFVLRKKFGNTLIYRKSPVWFLYSNDRLDGAQNGTRHTYWRLQSVTDRYGNQLIYDYGAEWSPGDPVTSDNGSLIPEKIYCPQRPNQQITIVRKDCRTVESVLDPLGNETSFVYEDETVVGSDGETPDVSETYTFPTMRTVNHPDGTSTTYTYETDDVAEEIPPPPVAVGQTPDATKYTWHFHTNIKTITDRIGSQHVFGYAQNASVEYYDASTSGGGFYTPAVSLRGLPAHVAKYVESVLSSWNSQLPAPAPGTSEWKRQYGLPRMLVSVNRPLTDGEVTFSRPSEQKLQFGLPEQTGLDVDQRPIYDSNAPAYRGPSELTTLVTDDEGNQTEYRFTGCGAELLDQDISVVTDATSTSLSTSTSMSFEWLMTYTGLTLRHGVNGAGDLGSESYAFKPAAGFALESSTGIYGDLTTWGFDDPWDPGSAYEPFRGRGMFTHWADPTSKTDALTRVETYAYGDYRVMTQSVDVYGTTTDTTVDWRGRRTGMVVTDAAGVELKRESYFYEHPQFKAFMTKRVVRAFRVDEHSDQPWEKDIVTVYQPDAMGRLWKETLDPGGENITTTHTYDLANRKVSTTDPLGNLTTFQYDSMGRVVKVAYPPTLTVDGLKSCFSIFRYDKNGNKAVAIDENGNATIWVRDSLNRIIHEIRDMDGQGIPTSALGVPVDVGTSYASGNITGSGSNADIVTTTVYNEVDAPVIVIDPRGFASISFRDKLQRPTSTFSGVPIASRSGVGGAAPEVPSEGTLEADAAASDSIAHTEMFYPSAGVQIGTLVPTPLLADAGVDGTDLAYGGSSAFDTDALKPYMTLRRAAVMGAAGTRIDLVSYAHYDATHRPVFGAEQFQGNVGSDPANFAISATQFGSVLDGKEARVTTSIDARGRGTTTEFDGLLRPVRVTVGSSFADPIGDELPRITETFYSSTGLVYRVREQLDDPAQWRPTETDYDSAGRPVKVWKTISGDPRNGANPPVLAVPAIDRFNEPDSFDGSPATTTEYDKNSNVVATINALNQRWDYQYDPRNRLTCEVLPAVVDATNPDDPAYPGNPVRPYRCTRYDGAGNVTFTRDERKNGAWSYFDRANRPTRTRVNPATGIPSMVFALTNPHDITTETQYDAGGLVLSVRDGNGNYTRNAYDSRGRLVYTITDPTTGDPTDPADPSFDPSAYQQLNSTVMLVSNQYDDSGNLTEVKDGRGAVTQFRYDGMGRKRMTIWDPGTPAAKYEAWTYDALVLTDRYDAIGNNQSGTAGRRTVYASDGHHLLREVHYFVTSGDTSVHPDNRELVYDRLGRLLSVTYPNDPAQGVLRQVAQSYDHLDRLIRETSAGVTHAYEYDKAGNRTKAIYGGTSRELYSSYDALNRLETIADGTMVTRYHYDRGGKVTRKELPNDTLTNTTYDFLGRALTITEKAAPPSGAILSRFDYSQPVDSWPSSYDGVGNVLQVVEDYSSPQVADRTVRNTYDHTYRLADEVSVGVTVNSSNQDVITSTTSTLYEYDGANNREKKSWAIHTRTVHANGDVSEGGGGGSPTYYYYGNGSNGYNSNQLISRGWAPNGFFGVSRSYDYDANGNRTHVYSGSQGAPALQNFDYDGDNRLVQVITYEGSTKTYQYSYDHRTRRVVRNETTAGGDATVLSFSGGTSVQEWVGGEIEAELIRGSDWGGGVGGVLYTIRDNTFAAKSYNSRGDVVSQTNGVGVVNWQASYEAFGTRTAESDPEANTDRQRGNTKEEDPTGLLNEGFRYRDLATGVFITRDPAGFVDGPNVYTYVNQNPWSAFDAMGLSKTWKWKWSETGFWGKVGTVVTSPVHAVFDVAAITVGEPFAELTSNAAQGMDNLANSTRMLSNVDASPDNPFFESQIAQARSTRVEGVKNVADAWVGGAQMPGNSFTGPVELPAAGLGRTSSRLALKPSSGGMHRGERILEMMSKMKVTPNKKTGNFTIGADGLGYITARKVGSDTLSVIDVKALRKREGIGTALYKKMLKENPDVTMVRGLPGMDNADSLLKNGNNIAETPRGKILSKLGFTEHYMDGAFMVSKRPVKE